MPLLYRWLLSNVQKRVLETHWVGQGIHSGWTRGGDFCSRSFKQREISIAYLWLEGAAGKGQAIHHTCVPITVSTKGLGQGWVSTGTSWLHCFPLHHTKLPLRNACLRTEWYTFPAACQGHRGTKENQLWSRKWDNWSNRKERGRSRSQYPVGPIGGGGRS